MLSLEISSKILPPENSKTSKMNMEMQGYQKIKVFEIFYLGNRYLSYCHLHELINYSTLISQPL